MYGIEPTGASTGTLWLIALVSLFVSGLVIYTAVRMALIHDRDLRERLAKQAADPAAQEAERAQQARLDGIGKPQTPDWP